MTFWDEAKRPYNLIMLGLTIVALLTGCYFYYEGKRVRNISYQINEETIKLYDKNNSSPAIKLLEKDSIVITQNVYLFTGLIWNSGDLPINKEDVRESLSIKLKDIERILDFKIIKQTEPSISQFQLIKKRNDELGIDWKYFDPNCGFSFQIIYIGKEMPGFKLNGKILDINTLGKVTINKSGRIWGMFVNMFVPLLFLLMSFAIYKNSTKKKIQKINFIVVAFILISLISFIVYKAFTTPIPPFNL